jgi:hypothetical protein
VIPSSPLVDPWALRLSLPGKIPRDFPGSDARLVMKGDLSMTSVPFTHCCRLLAIDAKTLRQWLKRSSLSLHSHPTDGRIKCLTMPQVEHLASLHGRSLKLDAASSPAEPVGPTLLPPPLVTQDPCVADPDLQGRLSQLEATVLTLQQHVAQLALELLAERQLRLQGSVQLPPINRQPIQATQVLASPDGASVHSQPVHPAELRARSRVIALIAYGADGSYVIIDPMQGELHLTPDSAQWFDWLATLSSFRFEGSLGRFTASRKGSPAHPSRGWTARRLFHKQHFQSYLGITPHLSIDRLEQVAASLQSLIASL